MEEAVLKNAIIKDAVLSYKDRGILTGWITLDYGGTCQGFGGYALYLPVSFTHHAVESLAGHWIFRVMEVAGVSDWSELPGKTIRARATRGHVIEIGHIVKDDWFNPEKDFAPEVKRQGGDEDEQAG
jgi:hypothetical protein